MTEQITDVEWDQLKLSISNLIQNLHMTFGWFNEEELRETPRRILDFYKEWSNSNEFTATTFPVAIERDSHKIPSMVRAKNISYFSTCSHHVLPFYGKVDITYLPNKKYIGISKLPRAVKKFASIPRMQETFSEDIADYLYELLDPLFLYVRVKDTKHLCTMMRGVRQTEMEVDTNALRFKPEMESKLDHLKMEASL